MKPQKASTRRQAAAHDSSLKRTASPPPAGAAARSTWYWLLCFGVLCQVATVLITWPVWQVRQTPPNLPLFDLPLLPFGQLVIISLVPCLIWPRYGTLAHAGVVALACVFDQYRLQPQVLALVVLLLACASDPGLWFARWYLATMWFWAGLHKLLSPEWWGSSSWWHLEQCGLNPEPWHLPFALGIALTELGLGLAAMVRPRTAAPLCSLMHLGVLASLSPLFRNFNPSVWPWNLASALLGYWILRAVPPTVAPPWRWLVPTLLLLVPAGYYVDLVNPHLASVLYSGNMPRAYHLSHAGVRRLDGWNGGLSVPFPDSPHLLSRAFERSAQVGDKLLILDPRPSLPDRYFMLGTDRQAHPITREQYLPAVDGAPAGVEITDPESSWRLKRAGLDITYLETGATYSISVPGTTAALALFRESAQIPNLYELKFQDAILSADAFSRLPAWSRLEIIELVRCQVPAGFLAELPKFRGLRYLHFESLTLPPDFAPNVSRLQNLQVLRLPSTSASDHLLRSLSPLPAVTWLDLSGTPVTSDAARHLDKFPACSWLNLSRSHVTSEMLPQLTQLKNLEVLELATTSISDQNLASLANLTRLQHLNLQDTQVSDAAVPTLQTITSLKELNLRGTRITASALEQLKSSLPAGKIVN